MISKNDQTKDCTCTHCFKNLGVESRMIIYKHIAKKGTSNVSDLVKLTNLTQPTVSYHLKEMRESGLLSSRKSGKEIMYRINDQCPKSADPCVLKGVKL